MNFGKLNLLALMLAVVFLCLSSELSAQSKPLKWKLAAGDRFEVTLNQTSSADSRIDSRKTLIENATTLKMNWDVQSVVKGTATIAQSFQGISLNVSNPAIPSQAVAFDTAATDPEVKEFSKPSKAMLKQIKPLIGLKFIVTMAASGEIKEVTLPPATADVINQLPDTVRIRQLFSPQGLSEILGASAIVFPGKPVESGESWTDKKPVTTPLGEFSRDRNYTVVGKASDAGDDVVEISMEPSMTPQQPAAGETDEEKSVESSLDSKLISFSGSGKLLFDTNEGYLKSSEFENELKSERPYREKTIETVVKNQIRMTISKSDQEK